MALPWKAARSILVFETPEDGFAKGKEVATSKKPASSSKGPKTVKSGSVRTTTVHRKPTTNTAAATKGAKGGVSGSSKLGGSQKRKEAPVDPPVRLTQQEKGKGVEVEEPEPKRQKVQSDIVLEVSGVAPKDTPQSRVEAAEKELERIIEEAARDVWDPAKEHTEYLKSSISEQGRNTGFVWGTHISQGFPDSILAYLPGYSTMQDEEEHPEVRAAFSRETFRLTTTAHQKKWAEEHPDQVVGQVLRSLHRGFLWVPQRFA